MNAFFQIMNEQDGTKLRLVPAQNGGKALEISDVINYLTYHKVAYQLQDIGRAIQNLSKETVISLNPDKILPIREELLLEIKEDHMKATGRFIAPSNDGELMTQEEILSDLRQRGVVYGIRKETIDNYIRQRLYLTELVLAKGQAPVQGADAWIEYFFNIDSKARPTLLEDGSVDFFHLNIINHCAKGDILARLHPEEKGEYGYDIMGSKIKPRDVKRKTLQFGHNINLSEDRTEITAADAGHVSFVEGRVFVSTLMEIENVDPSTGDVDFDGNVQINGNVCSNFKIHAKGNVEIRGVVEGAEIVCDGNITIARGMNGMGKGVLKAGGNIVAQFIENASVEAAGYVEAGSIMHSTVMAGTEVHVNGKKGFISGGHVSAANLIDVKILGSDMGTDTVVDIGISPSVKKRYKELSEQIEADQNVVARAIPILEAARDKFQAGKEISAGQVENIRGLTAIVKEKRVTLAAMEHELEETGQLIEEQKTAQVVVHDTVYPGTKIVISDVSKIIKDSMKYCKFVKMGGDVKMLGL